MKQLLSLCLLLSALVACNNSEASDSKDKEIFVSAAASLSGALEEITESYEELHPNITITYNLSGSGKLVQQIQQGAPVDVFLSADQHWMDVLEHDNLILPNTRINFAENNLVLITQQENDIKIDSLKTIDPETIGQIAVGNPKSVPAGSYAKEALTNLNLWDRLSSHFVYAKDVRQVLTYVESGNAEVGFVYGSDLKRADDVKVLTEVDPNLFSHIVYPAAVLSGSERKATAKEFLEFLQSDKAQTILEKNGFAK